MSERLILVGATATGKSAVAEVLASTDATVEIVNADSRQVIRGLALATAKPGPDAQRRIPHHLYDVREPGEPFSAGDWLALATAALAGIQARDHHAIVVGGTGLYITALLDGLDSLPPPDPAMRVYRTEVAGTPEGRESLVVELLNRDSSAASLIDMRNPRRVIRALEILDATGANLQQAWTRHHSPRRPLPPGTAMIGLQVDPTLHRRRIELRAELMFAGPGLLAEVTAALDAGFTHETLAASGIGYGEALGVITGAIDHATAVATTVTRTVRYAKAQRTYFRRDPRITWMDASAGSESVVAGLPPRSA